MEQNEGRVQDEITLREIIEILLKGKWIIGILTIVAILISLFVSFIVMPETYEARATLLVTPPVIIDNNKLEGIENFTDYFNNYPTMTVETYMEQILSPVVLQNTIKILNLLEDNHTEMTRNSLKEAISINNIQGTNLIKIHVKDKSPERAALIANTLSNYYIKYVTDNSSRQSNQVAELIQVQMINEEKNLNEKSMELAEYLSKSKNITELKGEVEALATQIVEYKTSLNNLDTQINSDTQALVALGGSNISGGTNNTSDVALNVNLNDGSNALQMTLEDPSRLEASLRAISINEIQTSLIVSTSSKKATQAKVEEMQELLVSLQTLLVEEEYKYNAINRELELAEQVYNAYQQRHKEAVLIAAADIGKTSVLISSEAITPLSPVSPNKSLNLAISAVLGFMLGSFIVFFMAYWKNSEVKA